VTDQVVTSTGFRTIKPGHSLRIADDATPSAEVSEAGGTVSGPMSELPGPVPARRRTLVDNVLRGTKAGPIAGLAGRRSSKLVVNLRLESARPRDPKRFLLRAREVLE